MPTSPLPPVAAPNSPVPFSAGQAGAGSKSSSFYFGTSVTVHTKSAESEVVRVMTLDRNEMSARTARGDDWQQMEIQERDRTQRARDSFFDESERRWDPLMKLVKDAGGTR